MKRCPECRRDYYDDTLLYCLDDGNPLLEGPSTANERATAIFPESRSSVDDLKGSTSDPEALTANIQRRRPSKKWLAVGGGGVVLVLVAIGFGAYKFWPKNGKTPRSMSVERLTTDGKSRDAAISPDGKYVVYVVDEGGQQSLWTRQVATTSNVQVIPPGDVQYTALVITPDNNYVNFVKREKADMPPALFQMPVLGGAQKKVMSRVSSGVSFSPDGKQVTFVRHTFPTPDESALMIANADGSAERVVATLKQPEFFGTVGGQIPSWAPDAKSIASVAFNIGESSGKVVEVQIADGSVKTIGVEGWHYIRRIAWLTDKSGFLILGAEKAADRYHQQVWSIAYPSGEVRRVTTDSTNYFAMSMSAETGTLAVVPFNVLSNIWVVPGGDTARATQIRSGGLNLDGVGSMAWTPDGRLVYQSLAGGNQDLWIMDGDGSGAKQLTTDTSQNFEVDVPPDGRCILFTSASDSTLSVWRMALDGSDQKQLTNGNSDDEAAASPDSKWVIFSSRRTGDWRLWKVSIDGGDAVQLTDFSSREAQVSPDGKLIACEYRDGINSPWRYAIVPFEGGNPVKIFDLPGDREFRWSTDSRSLIYIDTRLGVGNIWSVSVDGGTPKQLTHFKNEVILNFDLSPDGKQLGLARGTITNDVLLIKDFR